MGRSSGWYHDASDSGFLGQPGRLLTDYHTTQVPSSTRGRNFATRAQELAAPDLNTILYRRDYRTGAWHLGAVWPCIDTPRWTLEALDEAMRYPVFVPYLGRKSCPLSLPLAPLIEEAGDVQAALLARHRFGPEASVPTPDGLELRTVLADPVVGTTIVMDAALSDPSDTRHRRTEIRRDQPRSRRRWQFDLREEAVLGTEEQ
jgi:CRISPR system Cascade subunit CasD